MGASLPAISYSVGGAPMQILAPVPVEVRPKRTKIACVGFASNTRDLAPYQDQSWEIWGLNNLYAFIPRWDRWFETHDPAQIALLYGEPYVEFLKKAQGPVYMQKHFDEYPSSVELPRSDLAKRVQNGREFWPSSISYMIALAIDELTDQATGRAVAGAEIGLYGIDLIGSDEYSFQREGAGYLIGIAEGRGIKVTIPAPASLLKVDYIYGYEAGQWSPDIFDTFVDSQIAQYNQKKLEAMASVHTYDGAIQAYTNVKTMRGHHKRGGVIHGGGPGPVPGAPTTAPPQTTEGAK